MYPYDQHSLKGVTIGRADQLKERMGVDTIRTVELEDIEHLKWRRISVNIENLHPYVVGGLRGSGVYPEVLDAPFFTASSEREELEAGSPPSEDRHETDICEVIRSSVGEIKKEYPNSKIHLGVFRTDGRDPIRHYRDRRAAWSWVDCAIFVEIPEP